MRERVLADSDVRGLVFSGCVACGIALGLALLFVVLNPSSAGRFAPFLLADAAVAIAIGAAVAIRIRLRWWGASALMVTCGLLLAILAFLPLEGFDIAGRTVVLILSLLTISGGYMLQ